jgi:hypothetical protein
MGWASWGRSPVRASLTSSGRRSCGDSPSSAPRDSLTRCVEEEEEEEEEDGMRMMMFVVVVVVVINIMIIMMMIRTYDPVALSSPLDPRRISSHNAFLPPQVDGYARLEVLPPGAMLERLC